MKKLEELGISPAPWDGVTFCHPGMNGYVVSNANLPVGDTRRKIVASDVVTKNARLIAAAPKLYDAGWKTEAVLEKLFTLDEFAALLKSGAADALIACRDELRAALAEAAGESEAES